MRHVAPRRGLVPRHGLFEQLSRAARVLLVCAPAGSGKTVLLRSWSRRPRLQERVAWVSLERGERDAQRFWLSLIDALAEAVDGVRRVDPAPTFRGEAVVDQLLDDLRCVDERGCARHRRSSRSGTPRPRPTVLSMPARTATASAWRFSPNTVRTHLRHIYAKRDAHGRAEAVARARQLGLLAPALRR